MSFSKERFVKMLREPSTYAGLGLIAGAFGHVINVEAVAVGGMTLAGVLSCFLPELGQTQHGHEEKTRKEDLAEAQSIKN